MCDFWQQHSEKEKNKPSFAHFGLIEIMIFGLGR